MAHAPTEPPPQHDFDEELCTEFYGDSRPIDSLSDDERVDQIVRPMLGPETPSPSAVAAGTVDTADVAPNALTESEEVDRLIATIVPDLPISGPARLRGRLLAFPKR